MIYVGGDRLSEGGRVDLLKCSNCSHDSFQLGLYADTDMAYQGIVGLTDQKEERLVITSLTPDEYHNWKFDPPLGLEDRINRIFNTDSLKYLTKKMYTDSSSGKEIFASTCTRCGNYYKKISTITFDEFIERGGEVIAVESFKK